MNITDALTNDIKILTNPLKQEEELITILKKRLTKKEFKLYTMRYENISKEDICDELKLQQNRYDDMLITILKKLNYEKLKSELTQKEQ